MKPAGWILVQAVIACPNPIPVHVHQGHIERKEAQRAVDIEQRLQCALQLFRRRLLQCFAEANKIAPRLFLVLRFDCESFAVLLDVVAQVA
jgi:hypothetical protein